MFRVLTDRLLGWAGSTIPQLRLRLDDKEVVGGRIVTDQRLARRRRMWTPLTARIAARWLEAVTDCR